MVTSNINQSNSGVKPETLTKIHLNRAMVEKNRPAQFSMIHQSSSGIHPRPDKNNYEQVDACLYILAIM